MGATIDAKLVRRRNVGRLRVEQALVVRPQPEFNQRPRVGGDLGLPAVVPLVAEHSVLGRLVPRPGRLAGQVMFADERALDLLRALFVDRPLPMGAGGGLHEMFIR